MMRKIIGIILLYSLIAAGVAAQTTANAVITNNVICTWHYPSGAIETANVQHLVSVKPVYGLAVVPESYPLEFVKVNRTTTFAYSVSNSGNANENISISLIQMTPSWSYAVYEDTNRNGILDTGETVPAIGKMVTPNGSYWFAVVLRAPPVPTTANISGQCVISVATGLVERDGGPYSGWNGQMYGAVDVITLTMNAYLNDIYGLGCQYSSSDVTPIISNGWTKHGTPFFYWQASPSDNGFSFTMTTNATVTPDNIVDADTGPGTRGYPAMTTTYNSDIWYFSIKMLDDSFIWGQTFTFIYRMDDQPPQTPSAPVDAGDFVTTTSVTVTWNLVADAGPAGINRYELEIGTAPGIGNLGTVNVGVTTSYTYNGIDGQTLYFRVRAIDNVENVGAWSQSSNGIVVITNGIVAVLCRRSSTVFTQIYNNVWTNHDTPYFYWVAPTNIGYSYTLTLNAPVTPDNVIETTSNILDCAVPIAQGTYYFTIKMLRGILPGPIEVWTTPNTFIYRLDTSAPVLNNPPTMKSRYIFPASMPGTVNWDIAVEPLSGLEEYLLQISSAKPTADFFDGAVGTANTYTLAGVDGGSYWARVCAVDYAGNTSNWTAYSTTMSFLLSVDSDHDGIPNRWEVDYRLDPLNARDATFNYDYDELSNLAEYKASTNPYINNRTMLDTDQDALPDIYELRIGLNPNNATDRHGDLDGDHITNLLEYYYGTSPNYIVDSDADGMPDDWERIYGLNPLDGNDRNIDTDSDGVINFNEYLAYTPPNDRDNDGLPDWWELGWGLNPAAATDGSWYADLDNDGLANWREFFMGTSPNAAGPDTDGDSLPDAYELASGSVPTRTIDATWDTDGDGANNLVEFVVHTDPLNPDMTPPPDMSSFQINGQAMPVTTNSFVLTNVNNLFVGQVEPGTVVELWHIQGMTFRFLSKSYVGPSGQYTIPYQPTGLYNDLQLRIIDPAGNLMSRLFLAIRDMTAPLIENVRVDGAAVTSGDVISVSPVITAVISDQGSGVSTASMRLTIYSYQTATADTYTLSNNALTYIYNNLMTFTQPVPLALGYYDLTIYVEDNAALSAQVRVASLNVLGGGPRVVGRTLNYPNPFDPKQGSTRITYTLSQSLDVTIVMYTMDAQKIWERTYPAGTQGGRTGYNEVLWSGISDFGDTASNGVYLYHVVAKISGQRKVMAKGKILIRR